MAMIKCTECGKEFSDKAASCPHCGCPIEDVMNAMAEKQQIKEQKKAEKENKPKKEIKPEQKKKIVIISAAGICAVALIIVLAWYFGVKVPRDKAFATYSETVAACNDRINAYNDAVVSYNDKANQIIGLNDSFSQAIDTAQAVIDSGETPYEGEKLTTLSNTLKDARNNKVETPNLYEKKDSVSVDESLTTTNAATIDQATASINEIITSLESETATVTAGIGNLTIPDYSATISKIEEQQKALEDSYAIQRQITNPTQDWVLERLNNVENIANIACATEENDPNGHLGKDGGYTAQIYYSSPLLGTGTVAGDKLIDAGTDAGGSIEVYKTVEDAEKRNTYLASFDGTLFDSGKHIVLGTMVVRVSTKLTASKQEQFINEIIAELIAP